MKDGCSMCAQPPPYPKNWRTTLASDALRQSLDAAFATNDLQYICRAVDASVVRYSSVTEMAWAAGVDRTTLYRAFRMEKGPTLDTMIRVLRVLGFQLVVEARKQGAIKMGAPPLKKGAHRTKNKPDADTKARARTFTAAFRSRDIDLLFDAFAEALRAQDNVAAFARKMNRPGIAGGSNS